MLFHAISLAINRRLFIIDTHHELEFIDSFDDISMSSPLPMLHQLQADSVMLGRPYEVVAAYGKTSTYVMGRIPGSLTVVVSNNEFRTANIVEVIALFVFHNLVVFCSNYVFFIWKCQDFILYCLRR